MPPCFTCTLSVVVSLSIAFAACGAKDSVSEKALIGPWTCTAEGQYQAEGQKMEVFAKGPTKYLENGRVRSSGFFEMRIPSVGITARWSVQDISTFEIKGDKLCTTMVNTQTEPDNQSARLIERKIGTSLQKMMMKGDSSCDKYTLQGKTLRVVHEGDGARVVTTCTRN